MIHKKHIVLEYDDSQEETICPRCPFNKLNVDSLVDCFRFCKELGANCSEVCIKSITITEEDVQDEKG